jgi:hypothetical protein
VLASTKFAYASRGDKLQMVFDHIDKDGSGELDRHEPTPDSSQLLLVPLNRPPLNLKP